MIDLSSAMLNLNYFIRLNAETKSHVRRVVVLIYEDGMEP